MFQIKRFSDRDVCSMLQVQACKQCGRLVHPDERRALGHCFCGSRRSEMRMITREETTLCLKGKLHCYALFDGRMPSVELTHGIQSIDPVVIEHYRHCMDRFAKEEAPRYFRRMVAWRRENWAPIRDKISPARAIERLRRWLRAPEQEPRTE